EIVQSEDITRTDQVLDQLRNKIIYSLRQRGAREDAKDGMDLALCMLDQDRHILQFSGANNPLYLIRKVEGKPILVEYKADRMPIGYYQGEENLFTNNNIRLEKGDAFYLFTDGFLDQKGGEHNRKYMRKGFKDLLLEISVKPMAEQRAILDKTLSGWMGNTPQTDDILVIGVKV
ncbi:MAG: PP2C family protein-serine/threonine phosphatase, partial [Bacteroidales bacterium]